MRQQEPSTIRRRPDGSIDSAHYLALAAGLRAGAQQAAARSLRARLRAWWRGRAATPARHRAARRA